MFVPVWDAKFDSAPFVGLRPFGLTLRYIGRPRWGRQIVVCRIRRVTAFRPYPTLYCSSPLGTDTTDRPLLPPPRPSATPPRAGGELAVLTGTPRLCVSAVEPAFIVPLLTCGLPTRRATAPYKILLHLRIRGSPTHLRLISGAFPAAPANHWIGGAYAVGTP